MTICINKIYNGKAGIVQDSQLLKYPSQVKKREFLNFVFSFLFT